MYLLCLLLTGCLSKSQLVGVEVQEQAIPFAINLELKVPGWGDANSSNYCSWQGVSCNNHSLVEKLDLSHKNLKACPACATRWKPMHAWTLKRKKRVVHGEMLPTPPAWQKIDLQACYNMQGRDPCTWSFGRRGRPRRSQP